MRHTKPTKHVEVFSTSSSPVTTRGGAATLQAVSMENCSACCAALHIHTKAGSCAFPLTRIMISKTLLFLTGNPLDNKHIVISCNAILKCMYN